LVKLRQWASDFQEVYEAARMRNPRRWTRGTRNWTPITVVTLNPERDAVVRPPAANADTAAAA